MLLSAVFGFLTAVGVEMLIGVFKGTGLLALVAAPAVGLIGWSMFRKLWVRPRSNAPVRTRTGGELIPRPNTAWPSR